MSSFVLALFVMMFFRYGGSSAWRLFVVAVIRYGGSSAWRLFVMDFFRHGSTLLWRSFVVDSFRYGVFSLWGVWGFLRGWIPRRYLMSGALGVIEGVPEFLFFCVSVLKLRLEVTTRPLLASVGTNYNQDGFEICS